MANIAQGEAERYISIKAKWWVHYFTYSMWQGNGIKLSLIYSRVTIRHTNFADYFRNSGQIRMNCFLMFAVLSIAVQAEESGLNRFQFSMACVFGSIYVNLVLYFPIF